MILASIHAKHSASTGDPVTPACQSQRLNLSTRVPRLLGEEREDVELVSADEMECNRFGVLDSGVSVVDLRDTDQEPWGIDTALCDESDDTTTGFSLPRTEP